MTAFLLISQYAFGNVLPSQNDVLFAFFRPYNAVKRFEKGKNWQWCTQFSPAKNYNKALKNEVQAASPISEKFRDYQAGSVVSG